MVMSDVEGTVPLSEHKKYRYRYSSSAPSSLFQRTILDWSIISR